MNALTRRAGPLPRWAWLALALAAVAGYFLFVRPKNASAAAPGSSDASSQLPVTSGSATDQGSVNGSPSDAATADLLAALGNDNQQLLSSLAAQSQLFYQGFGSYVPGSSTGSAGEGGITALIGQTGLYPSGIDTSITGTLPNPGGVRQPVSGGTIYTSAGGGSNTGSAQSALSYATATHSAVAV